MSRWLIHRFDVVGLDLLEANLNVTPTNPSPHFLSHRPLHLPTRQLWECLLMLMLMTCVEPAGMSCQSFLKTH